MSRDRIDFFENAIKGECCSDPTKCELSASAANAASELASNAAKQQKGGIEVNNVIAVVPPNASSGGIRARGIALVQGKDSNKGGSYVAIESLQTRTTPNWKQVATPCLKFGSTISSSQRSEVSDLGFSFGFQITGF